MERKVTFLLSATLLQAFAVNCYRHCTSETLYATQDAASQSVTGKSCRTYNIIPAHSSSLYYLRISWSHFSIEGNMPDCKKSYVDVFLTRSYTSIGKFCKYKPFKMYSVDGFARITVNGTSSSDNIEFQYDLQSTSYNTEGSLPPSSIYCQSIDKSAISGEVFSTGWPSGYRSSEIPCKYTIHRGGFDSIKIVLMDVNLAKNSHISDYITLYGSDDSKNPKQKVITGHLSHNAIKYFIKDYKYLQIKFSRTVGSNSSIYRGFAVGYVKFDQPNMYGAILAAVFVSFFVIVGIVLWKIERIKQKLRRMCGCKVPNRNGSNKTRCATDRAFEMEIAGYQWSESGGRTRLSHPPTCRSATDEASYQQQESSAPSILPQSSPAQLGFLLSESKLPGYTPALSIPETMLTVSGGPVLSGPATTELAMLRSSSIPSQVSLPAYESLAAPFCLYSEAPPPYDETP